MNAITKTRTPTVRESSDGKQLILKSAVGKTIAKLPAPNPQSSPKWSQYGMDILLEVNALWGVTNIDTLMFVINHWGDDSALLVATGGHSQNAMVYGSCEDKILYCPDDSIWKGIQLQNGGEHIDKCLVIGASYGFDDESASGDVGVHDSWFLNCGTPNNAGSTPAEYGGGYGRWKGRIGSVLKETNCTYHCRDDGSPHASNQYAGRSVGHVISKRCRFYGTAHKFYCTRATEGSWNTIDCMFNGNQVSIGGGSAGFGYATCPGTHERARLRGNAYFQIQPGCADVHFIDTDITRKPWLSIDSRQTGNISWKGEETPGWSDVDLGGRTEAQAVVAGIGPT